MYLSDTTSNQYFKYLSESKSTFHKFYLSKSKKVFFQIILLKLKVKVAYSSCFYGSIHLFTFKNTTFSKCLSLKRVRLCFIVKPAQLKRRSTAALAGSGVFNLMNSCFKQGQVEMLYVSSVCVWRSL